MKQRERRRLDGIYAKLLKKHSQQIWCASGHCFKDMQTGGFDQRKLAHEMALTFVPGFLRASSAARERTVDRYMTAAAGIADYLLKTPLHWQVWYGAFCTDDSNNWCDWDVKDMGKPCLTNKVADTVEPMITALARKKNHKQLVSPGWFAVPSATVDLPAMADEITQYFADAGAFDRAFCQQTWASRGGEQ